LKAGNSRWAGNNATDISAGALASFQRRMKEKKSAVEAQDLRPPGRAINHFCCYNKIPKPGGGWEGMFLFCFVLFVCVGSTGDHKHARQLVYHLSHTP
jgi:hypothetical protein